MPNFLFNLLCRYPLLHPTLHPQLLCIPMNIFVEFFLICRWTWFSFTKYSLESRKKGWFFHSRYFGTVLHLCTYDNSFLHTGSCNSISCFSMEMQRERKLFPYLVKYSLGKSLVSRSHCLAAVKCSLKDRRNRKFPHEVDSRKQFSSFFSENTCPRRHYELFGYSACFLEGRFWIAFLSRLVMGSWNCNKFSNYSSLIPEE